MLDPMCGRIALYDEPERVARVLDARLEVDLDGWRPEWNLGPSRTILGVDLDRDGQRVLHAYRWGLIPGWVKDPSTVKRTFNARAESVATKPMYRHAFEKWRILVPVSGFFEWEAVPAGKKQPYYFTRRDGEPLVFAGLQARWRDAEGGELYTATIITTEAGPDMDGIHDRQPAVLNPEVWDRWLDRANPDRAGLEKLLRPPAGVLQHWKVDPAVGSVRNNSPELIAAYSPA
jgi:putative SOS response-associated peptidase YedK